MDILAQNLSAKYNVGADGLNGFQRDCNNHRWREGIPEDDGRPYIFITSPDFLSPKRYCIPVEGTIEEVQMAVWGVLDLLPHRNGKINTSITYIGPKNSTLCWFTPARYCEDVKILDSIKSFLEDVENNNLVPNDLKPVFGMK